MSFLLLTLAAVAHAVTNTYYCTNTDDDPATIIIEEGDSAVLINRANADATEYSNFANCGWVVSCSSTNPCYTRLTWTSFDVETNYDLVKVFDGAGINSAYHNLYSGSSASGYTTLSDSISVFFSSDSNVVRPGFVATIDVVSAPGTSMRHLGNDLPDPAPSTGAGSYSVRLVGASTYLDNMDTSSTITTTPGWAVKIAFNSNFNTEAGLDLVILYDGVDFDAGILAVYSGKWDSNNPFPAVISTGNVITVRFVSSSSFVYSGFTFTVSRTALPTRNTYLFGAPVPALSSTPLTTKLVFYSTNAANNVATYYNWMDRTVTFHASSGKQVKLVLSFISTEKNYDYLSIFDGTSAEYWNTPLAKLSGNTLPVTTTYTSSSESLTVRFTSDISFVKAGFTFTVSEV